MDLSEERILSMSDSSLLSFAASKLDFSIEQKEKLLHCDSINKIKNIISTLLFSQNSRGGK